LPIALIHLVQAKTRLPEGNLTHCKFGYFLFLMVGLYFPLNFTLLPTITPPFPQIAHCFAIVFLSYQKFLISSSYGILKLMLILLLFTNPLLYLMIAISILFAFTVHEYSHGQMAYFLGDPTAKYQGRLTLNPLAHFDPIFTTLIFIFGIGAGKPVPFNPHNLRNQKWGPALVALAGPGSNFLMALIIGLALRFLEIPNVSLITFFSVFVWLNIILGVFNSLPIPPLDGSHILFAILPPSLENLKVSLFQSGFFLIIIAIFFMFYVGFPFICRPLFTLITGMPLLF